MKKLKISIPAGLDEVEKALIEEGFDVKNCVTAGFDADITIITGVHEAYEEIEPEQYHQNGDKQMLIIDATSASPEEILKKIHRHTTILEKQLEALAQSDKVDSPKAIKISIPSGFDEVEKVLKEEGFDVRNSINAGLDADITIITGVHGAYEEIEPEQYHQNGDKKMLIIDATNASPEEVLKKIHRHTSA